MIEKSLIGHFLVTQPMDIHKVKAEYFTGINYEIVKAMKQLDSVGKKIDFLNVSDCGINFDYLNTCMDSNVAFVTEEHFGLLKELHETRSIKSLVVESLKQQKLNAVHLSQQILDLAESSDDYNDHIASVIDNFMCEINSPLEENYYNFRYDQSLDFLNRTLGGLRPGELNLVGARSGVGKTLFVMQNISVWSKNLKTLFISREMRSESLWKRILVRETGIDNEVFRERKFTTEHWKSIKQINEMFKGRNLHLNAKISTISAIKRRLYETKAELLIVDYLQIMDSEGSHGSREREIAWLSRNLKQIALDFNIPVIVLTQLNDNAAEHRPTGERDIRESKAPYQDSDNVIFLHKPTVENVKEWITKGVIDDSILEKYDLMEVNVVKQREGIIRNNLCRHIKSELRFVEIKPIRKQ